MVERIVVTHIRNHIVLELLLQAVESFPGRSVQLRHKFPSKKAANKSALDKSPRLPHHTNKQPHNDLRLGTTHALFYLVLWRPTARDIDQFPKYAYLI
jgi:hypothetical protein